MIDSPQPNDSGSSPWLRFDQVGVRLLNIECMPTSTKYNAVIELPQDIGPLLPYLAAEIRGCTYHAGGELNYMDGDHIVAVHPRRITITAVPGPAEAREMAAALVALINDVHGRRHQIRPVDHKQARLGPLAIYNHLPKTNCGACGEITCMAFAAAVAGRRARPRACPPLLEQDHTQERLALRNLLEQAEYDTSGL